MQKMETEKKSSTKRDEPMKATVVGPQRFSAFKAFSIVACAENRKK